MSPTTHNYASGSRLPVSFPAWAGVLVVVAISTLQLIAARALLVSCLSLAVTGPVLAIVARSMGLLTHLQWLPNLAVRRKVKAATCPAAGKSRKARGPPKC
ncbi:MAG: hypothetical protein R2693_05140 [Nocardioidaceae bacterium]